MDRRRFLTHTGTLALGATLPQAFAAPPRAAYPTPTLPPERGGAIPFKISLSQWGFHRAIFGDARENYDWFIRTLHASPSAVLRGPMDTRDIVVRAQELGVDTVDLVNILFFARRTDEAWLRAFKAYGDDHGVSFAVLMLDEAGHLGASDLPTRRRAIDLHRSWMDAAAILGCTSIRANAYGDGTYLAQLEQNAESMAVLAEHAASLGVDLLVENHGHPSSNAAWLAMLMESVNHPRFGVMADFDNFFMGGWGHVPERRYDTRQGMLDLAPYTRALSAKSYAFDHDGNETRVDFGMCLDIALEAGFSGYASAEYEGSTLGEFEGAEKTIALLKRFQRP